MKKINYILTITVVFLSCCLSSCAKKSAETVNVETEFNVEVKKVNHKWYYFTKNGYERIEKIQNVPECKLEPWTETVRISSANCVNDKAFAVVNRLGILCLENENIYLAKDENLF